MARRDDVADLEEFGRFAEPALLILVSLADGAKHGYAITEDIAHFAGVRFGPGSLYGAIARLESRGLIEALEAEDRRIRTSSRRSVKKRCARGSPACRRWRKSARGGWPTRDLADSALSAGLASPLWPRARGIACRSANVVPHGSRSRCRRRRCLAQPSVVDGGPDHRCERSRSDVTQDAATQKRRIRSGRDGGGQPQGCRGDDWRNPRTGGGLDGGHQGLRKNPYFESLLAMGWLVPFLFSQHYTYLKGHSARVQAVLIGGPVGDFDCHRSGKRLDQQIINRPSSL